MPDAEFKPENPWPWIAQYSPSAFRSLATNTVLRGAAVPTIVYSDDPHFVPPVPEHGSGVLVVPTRLRPGPPSLTETPLFRAMARELETSHEVLRILRAERVKRNGPTPPLTSMQRVTLREQSGVDPMHNVDEHDPNL
jgi:hypothetical protein